MKPVSKVSAFFIAFIITCVGNLAIHVPYIYVNSHKMPMGILSLINTVIFIVAFLFIPKKNKKNQ